MVGVAEFDIIVVKRFVIRLFKIVCVALNPATLSPVKAELRFVNEGVAAQVATPDPSPLTPVLIGSPVQLVSVPEVGVPSTGVTRVGEEANTLFPVPVFATETKFLLPSVWTASEAVSPVTFTPDVVMEGRLAAKLAIVTFSVVEPDTFTIGKTSADCGLV